MSTDLRIAALQRPVRRQLEQVQRRLEGLFKTPIPIMNQVGGHVLATRGKKFRPTLLLLTAQLRGKVGPQGITCAAVVELVHAASLIHDDSVDRSTLRRGLPTVNGLWTDEMAIIMVIEYAIATPSTNTQRRVSRRAVHSGRELNSADITNPSHGEY